MGTPRNGPHRHCPRRYSGGFTIVEMVVVIGIIVFLIALVSGLMVQYAASARVKATRALIHKIEIGLQSYYTECGRVYPPDTGYGLSPTGQFAGITYDAGALWRYLGKPVVYHADAADPGTTHGPFITFSERELLAYTDPVNGPSYMVVDPWRHPIGYVGDPRRVTHNRGEVDVFSAGPNGKTGCDRNTAPDLAYNNSDDDHDGSVDNAPELGDAQFNGALTSVSKCQAGEAADDINNWDPAN